MDSQTDQLPDRGLVAQLPVYCNRIAEIAFSSELWSFYFVATQELKQKKDLWWSWEAPLVNYFTFTTLATWQS